MIEIIIIALFIALAVLVIAFSTMTVKWRRYSKFEPIDGVVIATYPTGMFLVKLKAKNNRDLHVLIDPPIPDENKVVVWTNPQSTQFSLADMNNLARKTRKDVIALGVSMGATFVCCMLGLYIAFGK
jgi:heme/copper-type cytochrome/quinol oxidase subunit 3